MKPTVNRPKRRRRTRLLNHLRKKFIGLSIADQLMHIEAGFELYRALVEVRTLPIKRISKNWGRLQKPEPEIIEADPEMLTRVSRAVTVMARYLPGKLVCLPQAIAAQRILYRRNIPSALSLGLRHKEIEELGAHAWLKSGSFFITGQGQAETHTEVATFYKTPKTANL